MNTYMYVCLNVHMHVIHKVCIYYLLFIDKAQI